MNEDRVHHPYSPSQLQALEACSCYRGKDSKHERTVAGTIGHKVVETKLDDARLSDADSIAAAACIDHLELRKQELAKCFPGQEIRELKEIYLPIDELVFPDAVGTTAGYVDNVLIVASEVYAEMSDWKFGYWLVESAENNLQALAYILGLFKMFPKLQTVRFFFKLPNVDGFSEVTVLRTQIPAIYLRIQVIVARARKARESGNYDTATPMSPLCSFCANIADCPKVAALMLGASRKYWPLSVPDNITPTDILSSRDTNMCLRLAATAKTWAVAFKARVTDRVLRGAADLPEGHHIATNSGNRTVVNPDEFKRITLQYLTEEEYNKQCDVPGFGNLEDLIKEKAPRLQKEATVKRYREELEQAGAVAKGEPYSFLKASNDREKDKSAEQQAIIDSHK